MSSAIFIIGPAGTGKTTFCATLLEYYVSIKKKAYYVNLDPAVGESAVSQFGHVPVLDIREKWSLEDVMEKESLGPNGGLLRCMELMVNEEAYLEDALTNFEPGEILVVDCPGQIEFFLHEFSMKKVISVFHRNNYNTTAVFLMDATFVKSTEEEQGHKLVSGLLYSLSAMLGLKIPYLNVITKMDLIGGCDRWEDIVESLEKSLESRKHYAEFVEREARQPSEQSYPEIVENILETYGMSNLLPLDITETESIKAIEQQLAYMLQHDEIDLSGPDNEEPDYLRDENDEMDIDTEYDL